MTVLAWFVEHGLETLLDQRIFGLALGYEDLNDMRLNAPPARGIVTRRTETPQAAR